MERFWSRLFARFAKARRRTTGDQFPLDVLYPKTHEHVEMTSYHIRSRQFGRRLLGGLNPEEVTAFLDEMAEALVAAQSRYIEMGTQVTLLEREIKALTTNTASATPEAFPGAERQATSVVRHDDRKDDAATASRLEMLRTTALQEVEALLHDGQARANALTDAAHERAQAILREADALNSDRQKEAEQLVAQATVAAESILATVREQEVSLRQELDRLAESRIRMLDDVWATLKGCQEWLATVDPRRRGFEEREGRLDRVA